MAGCTIRCKECGSDFIFSNEERDFYARKGLNIPKRCPNCRRKKEDGQGSNAGFPCVICGRRGKLKVITHYYDGSKVECECGYCNGRFWKNINN